MAKRKRKLPKICSKMKRYPLRQIAVATFTRGGTLFSFHMFNDGTQQIRRPYDSFNLERVLSPSSQRVRWVLVDRNINTVGNRYAAMYPPAVAGPFRNFAHAITAFMLFKEEE